MPSTTRKRWNQEAAPRFSVQATRRRELLEPAKVRTLSPHHTTHLLASNSFHIADTTICDLPVPDMPVTITTPSFSLSRRYVYTSSAACKMGA